MLPRSAPRVVSSAAAIFALLIAVPALARPDGINGYSGKDGKICNDCHNNGGTAPQVAIAGPQQLTLGQTADYTFTVTTGAAVTGADIASSAGTLAPGNGMKTMNGDITHTAPVAPDNGAATYSFKLTAPNTPQMVTIWAAGNAANNDGTTAGDRAAGTMITVAVVAPPPADMDAGSTATGTGTPSGTPNPDGGSVDPASNGGSGGPGPNVERRPAPDAGAKPFSAGSDEPFDPTFAQTGLSCAVSYPDAPLEPGVLALVGLALVAVGVRRGTRTSREDA